MFEYLFRWSGAVVDPSPVHLNWAGWWLKPPNSLQITQIHKLWLLQLNMSLEASFLYVFKFESVGKYRKNPWKNWSTLNGCNSKNSKRMTTPLSKMVALLIPSPLTPKRGLGSVGSLSEAKKGVAKVCGDRLSSVGDYSRQRTPRCVFHGRLESPKDLQGLTCQSTQHMRFCDYMSYKCKSWEHWGQQHWRRHLTRGWRNFCPCKMLRPNGVHLEKTSVGTCLGKWLSAKTTSLIKWKSRNSGKIFS